MEAEMSRATLRLFVIVFVHTLAIASIAEAQGGLSRAVLEVSSTVIDSRRNVDGQLYGGRVVATISDRDGDPDNFTADDRIRFAIGPRGQAPSLVFPGGDRTEFESWARQNASALLAFLFPDSLSSAVLGRGTGEMQAQELLLASALETEHVREVSQGGRSTAGGLFEFETFQRDGRRPGDSARAFQGLYNVGKTVSLQGRFVQQREGFSTHATAFSVDYHPFVEIDKSIRLRIGGTARGGLLYSRSSAMDLGSVELGGGAWVSGFKDLGRVRIGGGTILQGSKSYIPPVFDDGEDGLGFLADAINERDIQYDIAYGVTAGVDTSSRTTLIVKLLQNKPVSSRELRNDSWLVQTALSYRFGLPSVNVGYKHYSTTGLRSHSVFVMGNFNW
jgi:hypothetical protein